MGIPNDGICSLCDKPESQNHLLFLCCDLNTMWRNVLHWIHIQHERNEWDMEFDWMSSASKGKELEQKVLETAFAETVYRMWRCRNENIFRDKRPEPEAWKKICLAIATVCEPIPSLNMFIKKFDGAV